MPMGFLRGGVSWQLPCERGALFVAQAAPHLRGGKLFIAGLKRGG